MNTWVVARRNFAKRAKTHIFEQENPENPESADVGRPLSCNAFATARFLVSVVPFSTVLLIPPKNAAVDNTCGRSCLAVCLCVRV